MVDKVEESDDKRIAVRGLVSASSIIQGTMLGVVDFQSTVRLLLSTQGSIEEPTATGWGAGESREVTAGAREVGVPARELAPAHPKNLQRAAISLRFRRWRRTTFFIGRSFSGLCAVMR